MQLINYQIILINLISVTTRNIMNTNNIIDINIRNKVNFTIVSSSGLAL